MAVRSLKNSTLENFANYSSSMNAGYSFQDYELIESVFLASPAASVTFNNLNQYATEYKHLQIRMVARCAFSDAERTIYLQLNGDSSNIYSNHGLYGTGSAVASYAATSSLFFIASFSAANAASGSYGAAVIDILDSFSNTKHKTMKALGGSATTPQISLRSSSWPNTNSVTSITLYDNSSNMVTGSRFSLYGIR
jgi:hypothetical protein